MKDTNNSYNKRNHEKLDAPSDESVANINYTIFQKITLVSDDKTSFLKKKKLLIIKNKSNKSILNHK